MVDLRPARPADAHAMARVQVAALRDGAADHYTDDQLAILAPEGAGPELFHDDVFGSEERVSLVAEADDEAVGFAIFLPEDGYLGGLFVDPAHAGEGVGTQLIEAIEERARDAGLSNISVVAGLNAVGFYEANGFERVEAVDASSDGDLEIPAVEMEKRL